MAPATTTAVSLPLVLRASFLFSGMFGIRLEGLKDQNGQPITVQSAMPLNFTVPAVLMNQTLQQLAPQLLPDRADKTRCLGKCKPANDINDVISPLSTSFNIISVENNGFDTSLPIQSGKKPTVTSTTTKKPPLGKPCGPGRCSPVEICVSWMKQKQKSLLVTRRESPMMVHECLPNDIEVRKTLLVTEEKPEINIIFITPCRFQGIHWTKMNPTGAKLCENGKTHSILTKQSYINCASQSEIVKDEPCEIIWNYLCVDEKDSPHSCSLRDCPFKGACIEVKHCDLKQLCYVEAVCTPEFLIPDKIRQNLRRKSGK